jgi:hypothetical protein
LRWGRLAPTLVVVLTALAVVIAFGGAASPRTTAAPVSYHPTATPNSFGNAYSPVPPTPTGARFSARTTPQPQPTGYVPGYVPGATAIRPTRPTTDPATPAFTPQDVTDYVNAHSAPYAVPGTQLTIESIQFLPNRDVNARFYTNTGPPDDALMCLVTLRGSFLVREPPGAGTLPDAVEYWVLDAHTGNTRLVALGKS